MATTQRFPLCEVNTSRWALKSVFDHLSAVILKTQGLISMLSYIMLDIQNFK